MSNIKYFMEYRNLLQEAIKIAKGENSGVVSGELVYAWRTQGKGSPGPQFKLLFNLSGKRFYGLQKNFIDNPNEPK